MPVVEKTPTSKHIYELINLIEKSIINRKITKIIFHCTATQQNTTVTSILKYWKETLGWQNPGYHIIITKDGSWTLLQDFNRLSNGVKGHNSNSINISYIGGIDKNGKPIDNRTEEQKEILNSCYFLFLNKIKDVKFHGHYEFTNKACPSFDVHNWIKELNK
jgi:N-acetylmuramoyl-L-alanine amidase